MCVCVYVCVCVCVCVCCEYRKGIPHRQTDVLGVNFIEYSETLFRFIEVQCLKDQNSTLRLIIGRTPLHFNHHQQRSFDNSELEFKMVPTNLLRTSYKIPTKFLQNSYNLQDSYKILTRFLQNSYKILTKFLQNSYKKFLQV